MDTVNLQNVLLMIEGVTSHSVLHPDGSDAGTWGAKVDVNWRKLRDRLPDLFLREIYDRAEVARWLNDAGYQTVSNNRYVPFNKELVTPEIEAKVYHWAYLISWSWESFDPKSFHPIKKRIAQYRQATTKGHMWPSASLLFQDLGAAENLDFREWEQFLIGLVTTDFIPTRLALHDVARPTLVVTPKSPMHAITLTIFVDRVLTKRQLTECKWCTHKFMARVEGQMFCSISHQSRWKTKFRRDKVKAVRSAVREIGKSWNEVARRATAILKSAYPDEPKEKVLVTPQWAKTELKGVNKR